MTPPTVPGLKGHARASPVRPMMLSSPAAAALLHAGLALAACIVTPLAMGSNIWPIAALFWGVLATPVAALLGAAVGWIVSRAAGGSQFRFIGTWDPRRTLAGIIVALSAAASSALLAAIITMNR